MGIPEVKSDILRKIYKKRDPWVHKYCFGHLLVIGGSKHYSGSPAFNALAALRSGVDLVTIAAPERAANIVASFAPDLIAYPLKGDYLTRKHLTELCKLTNNKTAVVIGGGLGRERKTFEVILDYLNEVKIPVVIDADAIHAVALNRETIAGKNCVITPHAHEFYVLSQTNVSTDLNGRISLVKEFAEKLRTTILLKGNVDVISNGIETVVNKTGCPFMTKGGMGDSLAGICGALLARGVNCLEAACAAAYINGRAGEIASKKFGESVTTTDLINSISEAIKF